MHTPVFIFVIFLHFSIKQDVEGKFSLVELLTKTEVKSKKRHTANVRTSFITSVTLSPPDGTLTFAVVLQDTSCRSAEEAVSSYLQHVEPVSAS